MQFGRWKALENFPRNGRQKVLCRCECGTERRVQAQSLKRGLSRSCGCLSLEIQRKPKPEGHNNSLRADITGQRFGKLVAVEDIGRHKGGHARLWKLQCDCGAQTIATVGGLRKGKPRSCGCLQREASSRSKDRIGKKYGRLTVVAKAGRAKFGLLYTCQCDCGSLVDVLGLSLGGGNTKSCGCVGREWIVKLGKRNATHGLSKTPEYYRHAVKRRRARLAGAEGSHTHEEWIAVCDRQKWRCAGCGDKVQRTKATKDHVVAITAGGSDWIENIQMLCKPCNSSKGAKHETVWRQSRGMLL